MSTIADRLSIAARLKGAREGWFVKPDGHPYPPTMWPKPDAPDWVGTLDYGTMTPDPVPAEYMEQIPDYILNPPEDPREFDREI